MKGRNLILMALITLIAGALMLVYRNALASHGIVIGCGILFILAGVANMTVFLGERDKDGRARMSAAGTALGWVASAAAVVLGVVMLLFRTVFEACSSSCCSSSARGPLSSRAGSSSCRWPL